MINKYSTKEVVLEAVKQDGLALEYANDNLQNDEEIVFKALVNHGYALKYANESFLNRIDVLNFVAEKHENFENIFESVGKLEMYNDSKLKERMKEDINNESHIKVKHKIKKF